MTDGRAAYDDESLPWLEAVASEDAPRGVSARKMLAALLLVAVAVALVAATFFLIGRRNAAPDSGPPELIRADPRPYKVKPADPGGLDVAGDSQTAFATSAGADPDAQIDLDAVPEAPVVRPAPPPKAPPNADVREPAPAPSPAPPKEPAPSASGSIIQLGAFSTGGKAEAAWQALSGRFSALAAMTKIIVPVSNGNGGTLYRLRAGAATPADAKAMCRSLRVAGESCVVVG